MHAAWALDLESILLARGLKKWFRNTIAQRADIAATEHRSEQHRHRSSVGRGRVTAYFTGSTAKRSGSAITPELFLLRVDEVIE